MPRLLIPEQVPGPANIQIIRCQREPGTEGIECLHDFQPAFGVLGQQPCRINAEIGIGALPAAPHPAPQLIQLR